MVAVFPPRFRLLPVIALAAALAGGPLKAQDAAKTNDQKLLRLAEILGAVHHLRELCGANEGQLWREQMSAILKAEKPPALLRQRMVAAFNTSYRGYQRTYGACTTSANTVAARFFSEGEAIAKGLAAEIGAADGLEKPEETIDIKSQSSR